MSRTVIPLQTQDVSSFAKALRAQLLERTAAPSHVELLNMLARAVGRRNFQDLKAQADETPVPPQPSSDPVDRKAVERTVRCFDAAGRLLRWPARRGDQILALWVLWSKIPPARNIASRRSAACCRACTTSVTTPSCAATCSGSALCFVPTTAGFTAALNRPHPRRPRPSSARWLMHRRRGRPFPAPARRPVGRGSSGGRPPVAAGRSGRRPGRRPPRWGSSS